MFELILSLIFLAGSIAFLIISARRWQTSNRVLAEARRSSAEAKERANIVIENFFNDKPLPEPSERRIGAAVQLPPNLIDTDDIAHLPIGATAYTVPWAMMTDEDMRVWINGSYTFTQGSFGTSCMRIQRVEGGVRVISGMQAQRPVRGLPWVGSEMSDLLPVVELPSHAQSRVRG